MNEGMKVAAAAQVDGMELKLNIGGDGGCLVSVNDAVATNCLWTEFSVGYLFLVFLGAAAVSCCLWARALSLFLTVCLLAFLAFVLVCFACCCCCCCCRCDGC